MLKQYFEAIGCEVLTGASGTEGLALAQQHEVHAILVDICMPDMNGDDVLAEVKRLSPNIPVIVMSGAERWPGTMQPASMYLHIVATMEA